MSDKSSYAGKIENSGTQIVKAPYKTAGGKKATVKKGGDLRTKGGRK